MLGLTVRLTLLALTAGPASSPATAEGGQVTMPLSHWQQLVDQVQAGQKLPTPPVPFSPIDRHLEGTFRRGLLSATLTARFTVLGTPGHVRVPVLDSGASLGEVLLDGKPTSLLNEGALYTVGVSTPGPHEVRLRFYWGREQDRFARRLQLKLPEGGATSFRVVVPEQEIEARLAAGALVSEDPIGDGTQLEGQLDGSGELDLSWVRRATHRGTEHVRLEVNDRTILTMRESLVSGYAVLEVGVLQGETDRVDLQVPDGVEVVRVDGPAVLQWRTDPGQKGRLTVLLRYLVEERTPLSIQYQYPFDASKPAPVRLVLPESGVAFTGAVGVQAPAGMAVKVEKAEDATELASRDIPPELSELTPSPLLSAFSFTASPKIELAVSRHQEVELTNTLVDELQASTVILEGGQEITKLKLRMRNNARQYLTLKLPPGSQLTHALIDGEPVRPAAGDGPDTLLLSLRQSEHVAPGRERTHTVRAGETLTQIANFYYSDPGQWRRLLEANRNTLNEHGDLTTGQVLQVPSRRGAVVEESSFVIELAYQRDRTPLGRGGSLDVALPSLDADTVDATWYLYLPEEVRPLGFDANLTAYSHVQYDPLRRLQTFLQQASWVRNAWAEEGGRYLNILKQRKVIFQKEEQGKQQEEVLSNFPLVGERYRFKRILLGRETPEIHLSYVNDEVAQLLRWLAFASALALAAWGFGTGTSRRRLALTALGFAVLLFVGQHLLGVHRRLVWGADLALLATTLWPLRTAWSARLTGWAKAPATVFELLSWGNLFLLVGAYALVAAALAFPLLLSCGVLVGLLLLRLRQARSAPPTATATAEVAHA